MEGNAAFFMLGMAVLGFVISTTLGIAICRLAGGEGNAGVARGFGLSVLAAVGVVSAAGALAWTQREQAPPVALDVAVEMRLPPGLPRPVPHRDGVVYVDLQSGRSFRGGALRLAEAREEDGRWIVPATIPLEVVAPERSFSIRGPQRATRYFGAAIPARPTGPDEAWSAWAEARAGAGGEEERLELRYRLVPRATPSAEERGRAALAALPADAPAEALRPFLSFLRPDMPREEAVRRLLARPDYQDLLVAWMGDADPDRARDAMFIAASLSPGSPAYAEAVRARAEEVVRIAAAIPPGPAAQRRLHAEAYVLAMGVVGAASGLSQQGADLRPSLRAMAEAVRPLEAAPPSPLGAAIDAALAHLDALAR